MDDDAILARALGYPYERPSAGVLLAEGVAEALHGPGLAARLAATGEPLEERTAVVGYGSNAAPSRLRRKLAGLPPGWALPVVTGRLRDADAVYSAHITRYGAIPATLHEAPGTELAVVVTLLSPRQAELVRRSEGGNYDLVEIAAGRLSLDDDVVLAGRARAYRSRHGALAPDGSPVALREVAARGRTLPEADQATILARVAARIAPEGGVRELVLGCVRDEALRRRRVAEMAGMARR